jgi:hypothetical protein
MTGEMSYINNETGIDSNGESWPIHLAIAKAVNGTLRPFDSYQGPYISVGTDITVGDSPYKIPVNHLGCIRLWVCYEDEITACVYREDTEEVAYFDSDFTECAIYAAKGLLT